MSNYTIFVENESGTLKAYAIVPDRPEVSGHDVGQVWSAVIATAHVPQGGKAKFVIPSNISAAQGASEGTLSEGVSVRPAQIKPVRLGRVNSDGAITYGQTVRFDTMDAGGGEKYPSFFQGSLADRGGSNAFAVETANSFTPRDVHMGNWFVGFSVQINGSDKIAACFMPSPGQTYQVKPSNTYWVVAQTMRQGEVVDPAHIEEGAIKVEMRESNITVVASYDGTLRIK
ncbi:hypothetical protein ACN47E_005489 [Coniothyrium glycines]